MTNFHSEAIDRLFKTFLELETVEDCYRYFEDLCTIKEVQDMAQRLETAVLLDSGENYQTISEKVGISTATIGRVSKCLKYGSGGYRAAIDKLNAKGE
ncbi:MAG: TrpR-related protein YerC/YecD [Clostridia bacterium]|nr:TrpR-related protein YerC/YecD [Clostridia bacterium]